MRKQDFFVEFFHFVWAESGNDPETAKATMEGLAFSSRPSRASGSEEAGRRRCLSFPAIIRKIKAGKRVLRRREGRFENGVKNPDRERGCLRIVSRRIPHPHQMEENHKILTTSVVLRREKKYNL